MRADLELLEAALGYCFCSREVLVRALTHKSHVCETEHAAKSVLSDNEQLEFLGDSALGFLVSEVLLDRHPSLPEGQLSKWKAQLVSADHLHVVARQLELGEYLLLGRGEEMSGGRNKKALLANALEAVIAALYLDGGMEEARRVVIQRVVGSPGPTQPNAEPPLTDFKGALQEQAEILKLPHPHYAVIGQRGPEHAKTFIVEVKLGEKWTGRADGTSKKSAGQKAAQGLLARLREAKSTSPEDS